MKKIIGAVLLALALGSCSKTDYVDAIPQNCNALMVVDATKADGIDGRKILQSLFYTDDATACGIDLKSKVYMFAAADGNFGLCAKVENASNLRKVFERLVERGKCVESRKRKGCDFFVLNNSWSVGFNDDAMLVEGPVTPAEQSQLQQRMAKRLAANAEQSITNSPLFAKLSSIDAPIAMVARLNALPEKMILPFTIGLPKNTSASQVMIAAKINLRHDALLLEGETFSFDEHVDGEIKKSYQVFRPIGERYLNSFSDNTLLALYINADGNKLLPLLHSNIALSALLTSINTAIDIDNILKSTDGDMLFCLPAWKDDGVNVSMLAEQKDTRWLRDVDYWKKSCPPGAQIDNLQHNTFAYRSKDVEFGFGITPDGDFFIGNRNDFNKPEQSDAQRELMNEIRGKRLAMVLNLSALPEPAKSMASMFKLFSGETQKIVFSVK